MADHSNNASTQARSAAQAAKNGGQVVEASLSSMRSIASSVSDSAAKITELGKRSDQIGKIVNVIDDIADQTNLLALNAAIEAARAGEQGRGFAVVADEVRKLAKHTTKATKEIAEMITAMQEETKRAIGAMQAGTAQVEHGVEQTSQAGVSLQEIIRAADTVGDMIAQVATAATQQAATTQEVSSNVEQTAKITNFKARPEPTVGACLPGTVGAGAGAAKTGGSIPVGRALRQPRTCRGGLGAEHSPPIRTTSPQAGIQRETRTGRVRNGRSNGHNALQEYHEVSGQAH